MTLSLFTGSVWANLFEVDVNTGVVTRPEQQRLQLNDPVNGKNASIRQNDNVTEFWASDGTTGETFEMQISNVGVTVSNKLGIGIDPITQTTQFGTWVVPNQDGGTELWVNDATGTAKRSLRLLPGKLGGGIAGGSVLGDYFALNGQGLNAWVMLQDVGGTSGTGGFYLGDQASNFWTGIAHSGTPGNDHISFQSKRTAQSTTDFMTLTNNGVTVMRIGPNGQVYGSGPYVDLSDAKTKDDIEYVSIKAEDVVMGLSAKQYRKEGKRAFGFIAHEVERILPEAVVEFNGEDLRAETARYEKTRELYKAAGLDPDQVEKPLVLANPEDFTPLKGVTLTPIVALLLEHVQVLTEEVRSLRARP
jgi:hypothetical protein